MPVSAASKQFASTSTGAVTRAQTISAAHAHTKAHTGITTKIAQALLDVPHESLRLLVLHPCCPPLI